MAEPSLRDLADIVPPGMTLADLDPFQAAAKRVARAAKGGRREGKVTMGIEAPGKIAEHFLEGARTLPQRSFEAATRYGETGEYDPGIGVELATTVTGGRFPFARARELGAGGGKLGGPSSQWSDFARTPQKLEQIERLRDASVNALTGAQREYAARRLKQLEADLALQVDPATASMLEAAGGRAPIVGLPQKPFMVGGEPFIQGPNRAIAEAAEAYMAQSGRPYVPVQNYAKVDVDRAKAIAKAYDVMPHTPTAPAAMRSYEALARETREQYEALKKLGIKFEPNPAGDYPTPWHAMKDLRENKHLYYFPSEQGFGSGAEAAAAVVNNPMLKGSGIKIGGKEVPFNDLFRIVHDVFGHAKTGTGFRAPGEENAWRAHARMYSPEALPAMTAETRGQNSWVNFGPEAERNLGASGAATVYAPQKIGMLPQWVIEAGRMSPLGIAGLLGVGAAQER